MFNVLLHYTVLHLLYVEKVVWVIAKYRRVINQVCKTIFGGEAVKSGAQLLSLCDASELPRHTVLLLPHHTNHMHAHTKTSILFIIT